MDRSDNPPHRIVLVEAAPRILLALPGRFLVATTDLPAKMGLEARAGTRVAELRADGMALANGGCIRPS